MKGGCVKKSNENKPLHFLRPLFVDKKREGLKAAKAIFKPNMEHLHRKEIYVKLLMSFTSYFPSSILGKKI